MGCTLQEAYDMTWSEFRIRSFALKRVREYEMQLVREVAYEVHTTKYIFGKKRPPNKEKYWPIGEKPKIQVTERMLHAFRAAKQRYNEKKKNGTT